MIPTETMVLHSMYIQNIREFKARNCWVMLLED